MLTSRNDCVQSLHHLFGKHECVIISQLKQVLVFVICVSTRASVPIWKRISDCVTVCTISKMKGEAIILYLQLGVRILCSKISELCYALMLTIYANYAPQISHYAPEICHYASKQNNFFKSQTA